MAEKRGTRYMGQYTPPKERDPLAAREFADQIVGRTLVNSHGLWTAQIQMADEDAARRARARWNEIDDDIREGLRELWLATFVPMIERRDRLLWQAAKAQFVPEAAERVYDFSDLTEEEQASLDGVAESPLAQAYRRIAELERQVREMEERAEARAAVDKATVLPATQSEEVGTPHAAEREPDAVPSPEEAAVLMEF